MNHDTANASSAALMAFLAGGADVVIKNSWVRGRSPVTGMVRVDVRTSGSVLLIDNDVIPSGPGGGSAPSWVYGGASTPAGTVTGWGNKSHGVKSTYVTNIQRMRLRQDTGPNIASANTITWDPDYDTATITGTTLIKTINLIGTSQIGYDGAAITLHAPSGWSTDATGNIQDAYTVAAGAALVLRYNAATSKWVKIGG